MSPSFTRRNALLLSGTVLASTAGCSGIRNTDEVDLAISNDTDSRRMVGIVVLDAESDSETILFDESVEFEADDPEEDSEPVVFEDAFESTPAIVRIQSTGDPSFQRHHHFFPSCSDADDELVRIIVRSGEAEIRQGCRS